MEDNQPINFKKFESFPEDKKIEMAQEIIDRHFPPGSKIETVISSFQGAGAVCAKGESVHTGIYYECDYNFHNGLTPILTEWKIIINPNSDEETVSKIVVNRGLTGL